MAVKAGTAYIAFEPIGLQELRSRLMRDITAASQAAGAAGSRAIGAAGRSGSEADGMFTRLVSSINRGSTALRTFGNHISQLGFQMQMLGVISTAVFTLPVVGAGVAGLAIGVKFAAQVEQAQVALKALLPVGYDVDALMKRLQATAIASPVFDSATLVTFTQRMVAAGVEINKTERFLKAFGNIAVTAGVPMDKMTLALQAFAQMAGKGKVEMEELRQQLGDSLPGALKIAADGLGVTQQELFKLVKAGKVTADDLMTAFIKIGEGATYTRGAAAGAQTLQAKWDALKESFQSRVGTMVLNNMDALKNAFDRMGPSIEKIIGLFERFGPTVIYYLGQMVTWLDTLKTKFDELDESDQKFVKFLAITAVVAGPVIVVLGTIGTAVGAIAGAFAFLGTTAGLVVLGIIAVGAAIYAGVKYFQDLYDKSESVRNAVDRIKSVFQDDLMPVLERVWESVKSTVIKAFDEAKESLSKVDFSGFIDVAKALGAILLVVGGVIFAVLVGAFKALGPIIGGVIGFFAGLIRMVSGLLNIIAGIFTLDFSRVWEGIKDVFGGMVDSIWSLMQGLVDGVVGLVTGFVDAIIGWFEMLYDILVGHSIVPDMVDDILKWIKDLPGKAVAFIVGLYDQAVFWFKFLKYMVLNYVSGLVMSALDLFRSMGEKLSGFVQAMADKAGEVFNTVKEIPGKIVSAIGNLGLLLYNTGKDVVKGLINGIGDMAGALKDKATSVAKGAKDAFTGLFDINSPSRVMFDIGRDITAGLTLGLTADIGTVTNAAVNVSAGVITPIVEAGNSKSSAPVLNIGNFVAGNASPAELADELLWMSSTRGWAL